MKKIIKRSLIDMLDILDLNRRKGFVHVCVLIEVEYRSKLNIKSAVQKIYRSNNISSIYYYYDDIIDQGEFNLDFAFYIIGVDRKFINYKLKKLKQEVKDYFNQLNYTIKFKDIDYDYEYDDLESYFSDHERLDNIRANLNEQIEFNNLKGVWENG